MAPRAALASRPYWSIFAKVYRDHQTAARKTKDADCREYCEYVMEGLSKASIVYLPTTQVAPGAKGQGFGTGLGLVPTLRGPTRGP